MKTIEDLLKQTPIYLGYHNKCKEDLAAIFEDQGVYSYNVLFSAVESDYQGYAFLLLEQDGSLYEVNGFYCSDHGLENQFEPELTTLESIKMRLEAEDSEFLEYYFDKVVYKDKLKEFLGI